MEFTYKGRRVVLRGTRKTIVEWMGGRKLQKTMMHLAQLFALQLQLVDVDMNIVTFF